MDRADRTRTARPPAAVERDAPPPPELPWLSAIIRSDVAEDKVRIDTPTQNLESYFLGVVQKAKQSEAETSGATSGNRVAAYLRGDADATSSQTAKVLERLTLPTASEAAPVVEAAPGNGRCPLNGP